MADQSAIFEFDSTGATHVFARESAAASIAIDAAGNLYATDARGIAKIAPDGSIRRLTPPRNCSSSSFVAATPAQVYLLSGCANGFYTIDAQGHIVRSRSAGIMGAPAGFAADKAGNLYVSEYSRSSQTVERFEPNGKIKTIASNIFGNLAVDSLGDVYVSERGKLLLVRPNGTVDDVRSILGIAGIALSPSGQIYATNSDSAKVCRVPHGGTLKCIGQSAPVYVTADASGNVYFAELGPNAGGTNIVEERRPDGTLTAIPAGGFSSGIAVDASGTLYVAERRVVRKIVPGKSSAVLASGFGFIEGIAADDSGTVYVTDGGSLEQITPSGAVKTVFARGTAPCPNGVVGVAIAPGGTLYIVEPRSYPNSYAFVNGDVCAISKDGKVTTVGKGWENPQYVAVGRDGNVFVTNWSRTGGVVKVAPSGAMTCITGSSPPACNHAAFHWADDIAAGPHGGLFVTEPTVGLLVHVQAP